MAEPMMANAVRNAARYASGRRTSTAVPRLTIWCSATLTDPTPAMFEPKFYLLLQGAKRLTIGGTTHHFGPGSLAISTVGLPFTSQVVKASPKEPYLGLELSLDTAVLASVLSGMPDAEQNNASAFSATQITEEIAEPVDRLLRLLASPADIPTLAPLFERELFYRLAQGPTGGTLRKTVQGQMRFSQIRTALNWICNHADEPMCVQELAASVGMSVTSFHRHFKAVTSHSPLAYQRHVRLLGARERLVSGATSVTTAAFTSGYASTSQFSREYKRMFGVSPMRDAVHLSKSGRSIGPYLSPFERGHPIQQRTDGLASGPYGRWQDRPGSN